MKLGRPTRPVGEDGHYFDRSTSQTLPSPSFICAQPTSQRLFDLTMDGWGFCQRGLFTRVFHLAGIAFIILCPSFWHDLPFHTPVPANCHVIVNNKFPGTSTIVNHVNRPSNEQLQLMEYRKYWLLRWILRYLLGESALSFYSIPSERFEWNQCAALPASSP